MKVIHRSGSRKTAVARATLREGVGVVRVNHRLLSSLADNVFRAKMQEPLMLAGDAMNKLNIDVLVRGGGPNAQAEATRVAIARTLSAFDKKLHSTFLEYDRGMLVADIRLRETRKPNTHGKARSKRQKSYR